MPSLCRAFIRIRENYLYLWGWGFDLVHPGVRENCYYPHFTVEGTESQKLSKLFPDHKTDKFKYPYESLEILLPELGS